MLKNNQQNSFGYLALNPRSYLSLIVHLGKLAGDE